MIEYELNAIDLDNKGMKVISSSIGEGKNVAAVFRFNESYVIDRTPPDFSGLLAVVGPILEYHVFRHVGLKLVHCGMLVATDETVEQSEDISNAITGLGIAPKLRALVREVKAIHPHVLGFFKTQELDRATKEHHG